MRVVAALVLAFLTAPMLAAILLSFSPAEVLRFPPTGFSTRWYADFFTSDRWVLATRNSLVVAAATTLVATPLGTAAAVGLHLGRFAGREVILALLTLPMVTPFIVTAAALFFAFSAIGLAGTLPGLVLGHTVVAVPFVVISVLASLAAFDDLLLRAAASLGATPGKAFRRVMLPRIWPGVAAGAVFAFATSLDEFVITLFLAGPGQFTLPRQMYANVREYMTPTILAASAILLLASLVLLLLAEALTATTRILQAWNRVVMRRCPAQVAPGADRLPLLQSDRCRSPSRGMPSPERTARATWTMVYDIVRSLEGSPSSSHRRRRKGYRASG
jgi:putative spermidine/putrescine transport system permease protein